MYDNKTCFLIVKRLPIQNAFLTKCNSCRIAVQWFYIKRYSDILYTKKKKKKKKKKKSAVYLSGAMVSFFFVCARYDNSVPRLSGTDLMGFCNF